MKNTCSPAPEDVRIATPHWAAGAAAAIGARAAERIGALGVRGLGDPGLLAAVPDQPVPSSAEPRTAPEVAARTLYGALAAAASASVRTALARGAHQTPSKGLVRVLGHRCPKRLERR
ncbi:hypothetical protein [Streptomyces sp. NPDC058145]|uniref:hypothetical protein n=1 Tax=Streptomyces sp. NPDC058145 TaxID=3346356 RepID=UPI0036DFEDA8